MKFIILVATVLSAAQAGQIPPEATVHQVSVPVPATILIPPLPEMVVENVELAVVKEVSKDHVHIPDMEQPITKVLVTVQPEEVEEKDMTTIMAPTTQPSDAKNSRQTRAVPYTDMDAIKPQLVTDVNVIRSILNQRKTIKMATNMPPRSMRSVEQEIMVTPANVVPASSDTTVLPPPLINHCDLLCTKFEFDPICATNGICLHEFPNQCILDTYNCKNPSQKFSATKDDRCQMHWLTKCNAEELF